MTTLLECGPLSAKDGEGRTLFHGARLTLDEGRLALLEGPSGSGKSTLLRQVAALLEAPGASRRLEGEEYGPGRLARWRARVTLAAQDAPVLPGTVAWNLEFPFAFRHARRNECDPAAQRAALDGVGLERLPLDRDVATLSGGERHRLALARALLWDPPVLLADEPLAGLDPDRAALCFERLAEHAHRAGRAVLCVLHEGVMGFSGDRRLRLVDSRLEEA
ncbi:MAG: ATP-binding cassette domain-containing protein [Acidobacteria bacterium]|jgi:ABC-type iron transport system FetAB ATPase subunit|nr:ATP-binding cassette domain-containing protein [Acidobacteriota bacterium]